MNSKQTPVPIFLDSPTAFSIVDQRDGKDPKNWTEVI